MPTTWVEPKRLANLAKHGFDFADFETRFDGETALIRPAYVGRTDGARYLLIGDWNGTRVGAEVVSPLGSEALSLVSLGAASPKEAAADARHIAET
ncbi:BrnT family toxin [Methylobacterium sp. J-088]|uniref:BrnT family toxin n=1 Tax=Methylobacterium sp. J-088 TaxID=2836664 RepID=UPI001FB99382|nr:BrnT family toxin [Methylobacterium sp. J-088]MCJ2066790.1 BrnT family toxin [Methylobacterium sp. J-088]